ncbi:MAG: YjjG family noncanonical pyrimidine nucleotidase [Muribaculaceae bacterium]|nr:YjjG family noncanonical pyrimidine nucleotidase [Muribaculaceae bacterium]
MNHPSIHFSRPRWIFFDLDDTLWDFNSNSLKSLLFIFNRFSIISSIFGNFDSFVHQYRIHNSKLWEEHARGMISSSFLKTERWRRTLFPDLLPERVPVICRNIDVEYLDYLATQTDIAVNAIEVLHCLSRHFMIGVISNGFKDTQYKKLYNSGLWRYVTRMVISDEIAIQKPDTRIFRHAIRETGASGIPVMVGDNPEADILGALQAGWDAIWFNSRDMDFPFSEDELRCRGINPDSFLGTARNMEDVSRILQMRMSGKHLLQN